MAGLLYFKFGTQKSGIDHHFAPYVRDLVPDTLRVYTVVNEFLDAGDSSVTVSPSTPA